MDAAEAQQRPVFFDDLEREVGHDGVTPIVWRVGGYAVVVRGTRLLMVQGPGTPGRWDLPGGGVDPAEDLVDGVAREVHEETGYRFAPSGPVRFGGDDLFFVPPTVTATPYRHCLNFFVPGDVSDGREPGWRPAGGEIATVSWVDLAVLSRQNTIPMQWAALVQLGLVTASA